MDSMTRSPDTKSVQVETVSLATLVEDYSLSDSALIIDIEGAEAKVTDDELAILEAHFDLVIIEFHDVKDDINESQRARIHDARYRFNASEFDMAERRQDVVVYVHSDRYPDT